MTTRKRILAGIGAVTAVAAVSTFAMYRRDMRSAHERVQRHSQLLASPFGDIEFSEGGNGSHVLVVHGSGGGFDQAELLVQAVLGDSVHWIAPSRFGYLRSTFRAGATFDEQAHAYAYLLDHLGIDRVAVVALSHGAPSALLFAALHPERVSSLSLISAGVASSADASQQQANQQGNALTWIFQRDYRYWAITTAFRRRFLGIMGVDRDVIDRLTPDQRRLADQVIEFMNPVSLRAAGVRFDNQAALPNDRIAAIRAPTLILHAKDDTLQRYRNAEFAAATIPDARLVGFERGGHLLMAVEQSAIRALIDKHIVEHPPGQTPRRNPDQADTTRVLGQVERDLTGDGRPEVLRVVGVGRTTDRLEVDFIIESAGSIVYRFKLQPLTRAVGFDAGRRVLSAEEHRIRLGAFGREFFADQKFQRPAEFVTSLRASAPAMVAEIPRVISRDRLTAETRTGAEIWEEILGSPVTVFTFSPGGDAIVPIGWSARAGRFYRLQECC